jgi:hypothetical protein
MYLFHISYFSILTKELSWSGISASSTNKTNRHYITEILLKIVFNTINQTILTKISINN